MQESATWALTITFTASANRPDLPCRMTRSWRHRWRVQVKTWDQPSNFGMKILFFSPPLELLDF